jgi:hypothetical protein
MTGEEISEVEDSHVNTGGKGGRRDPKVTKTPGISNLTCDKILTKEEKRREAKKRKISNS